MVEKSNGPSDDEDGETISLQGLAEDGNFDPTAKTEAKARSAQKSKGGKVQKNVKPENSAFEHYQASKDEVDQALAELDPDFTKSLKDLSSLPTDGVDIEPAELDESLLKEEKITLWMRLRDRWAVAFKPYYWIKDHCTRLFLSLKGRGGGSAKKVLSYLTGEGRAKALATAKSILPAMKQPLKTSVQIIKSMSRRRRILLGTLFLLAVFFLRFFGTIVNGRFLPSTGEQILKSFNDVADRLVKIDPKGPIEAFDSPLRHPEYIVLLKRIVVNLQKPAGSGRNPMGMFEFYVEANNQEAAVELKAREVEMTDAMQRTVEGMSYPELREVPCASGGTEVRSAGGKQRMKKLIRQALNTILTRGRVKNVYLKSITLKP